MVLLRVQKLQTNVFFSKEKLKFQNGPSSALLCLFLHCYRRRKFSKFYSVAFWATDMKNVKFCHENAFILLSLIVVVSEIKHA